MAVSVRRERKAAAIYAQTRPEKLGDILARLPGVPPRPPVNEHPLLGDYVWSGMEEAVSKCRLCGSTENLTVECVSWSVVCEDCLWR